MLEIIRAFLRGEQVEDHADAVPSGVTASLFVFSQQRLEFCEHHFDGIEIGRVWRQIQQPCVCFFDDLAHARHLVSSGAPLLAVDPGGKVVLTEILEAAGCAFLQITDCCFAAPHSDVRLA